MNLQNSSNASYHANRTHLSSSMLKLVLTDIKRFHKEWILGEVEKEVEKSFYVEGSYLHSLILEPEKIASEYAFFQGLRKAGKDWELFKSQHDAKTILSAAQVSKVNAWHSAYKQRPEALVLCSSGLSEHTMVAELLGIPVKARADYINIEQGYIVDVKTTGYASGQEIFAHTCKEFMYDLSAALYARIASEVYGKPFEFYWVVVSKQDLICDIYKASAKTMGRGNSLVNNALLSYTIKKETGDWEPEAANIRPLLVGSKYDILEV